MIGQQPRIETIPARKIIGKRVKMTLENDRTPELWRSFMPIRKQIKNTVSTDLLCVHVFDPALDFADFNPGTSFEKWAAAEVTDYNDLPEGMETHKLNGGLYAVFSYVGIPSEFEQMFRYIFYSWIPQSKYNVDKREHFEVLGDKYRNNDPSSEEEIWIPIKLKS